MDAKTLTQYAGLAEVVLIEAIVYEGRKGYWVSNRKYERSFVGEDDVYAFLDKRTPTLFTPAQRQQA